MPSKRDDAAIETPPTLMSRSESLGRPPATKAWASTTERIGRRARSARTRRIASASAAPGLVEGLGVEVGESVDRDRTVGVLQQDRRADSRGVGPEEDAGRVDQARAEPEALGGVVVAGRQHDLGP